MKDMEVPFLSTAAATTTTTIKNMKASLPLVQLDIMIKVLLKPSFLSSPQKKNYHKNGDVFAYSMINNLIINNSTTCHDPCSPLTYIRDRRRRKNNQSPILNILWLSKKKKPLYFFFNWLQYRYTKKKKKKNLSLWTYWAKLELSNLRTINSEFKVSLLKVTSKSLVLLSHSEYGCFFLNMHSGLFLFHRIFKA